MPTYEYECGACGHKFEAFQSITAEPLKQCPECKKKQLRRLIGAGAGIIFKGSGFYETDYKRKNRPNGKDTRNTSSSNTSSSESKSDSAKTEAKNSSSKSSDSSKTD